ncbi:MAG: hypothetical protein ACYCS7_09320 [Acidimicrobiales bacterium]
MPVPGASISLSGPSNYSLQTSSTGAFSVNLAAADYKIDVRNSTPSSTNAYPAGFFLHSVPITISGNLTQNLTIPVAAVTVSVLDPSNSPVAGATISLGGQYRGYHPDFAALVPGGGTDDWAWVDNLGTVTTDNNGTATFDLLPTTNNSLTLTASPPTSDTTFTKAGISNLSVTGDTTIAFLIQSTDTTPPVIQAVLSQAPTPSGWVNTSVTVSFNCSDTDSGVAKCSPPVTKTTDGSYTITGTAEDHAGNVTTVTQTVNVDKTPPTITPVVPAPNASGWYNQDVPVSFTCADPTVNGVASGVASCPGSTTASTEGAAVTVTGTATDNATNTSTATVKLNIDKTPPTITAPKLPSPNAIGWYNHPMEVTFACADSLSGVTSCQGAHLTDGANQTATGLATDRAGNTAQVSLTGINVDTTPPGITASVSAGPSPAGWYNHDVTVNFACTDALSGVASCPASQTVSTEGASQTISGTATDKAGNSATANVTLNIDKTPPTISATSSVAPGTWVNHDVTVRFTCGDTLSGVATCPADATVTSSGKDQTVTGTAIDNAGNTANASVRGIDVDKAPPTITATATTPPDSAGWYHGPVTIHFTCTDALSGVAYCPGDVRLSKEGAGQSVTGTATDVAGNQATATVTGINIDLTPPVSAISTANDSVLVQQSITGTATDNLSGVASVQVTFTPVAPGLAPTTVKATLSCSVGGLSCAWSAKPPALVGSYVVSSQAVDRAANAEGSKPTTTVITISTG